MTEESLRFFASLRMTKKIIHMKKCIILANGKPPKKSLNTFFSGMSKLNLFQLLKIMLNGFEIPKQACLTVRQVRNDIKKNQYEKMHHTR